LANYAGKESSRKYREEILSTFERTWPNLDQKIRAVSASDVQEWLKRLQWKRKGEKLVGEQANKSAEKPAKKAAPKGYSPQRYNRLLTTAEKFFKAAVRKGVRLDNPIEDLDRKKVAVSKALTLPTEAEFHEIVETIRNVRCRDGLKDDSADFVLFLRYTGCRIGEASLLKRADVDVKNWQLNIPGAITKNGQPRSVTIVEPLQPIITRWLAEKVRGEFLTPTANCRKALANACKRLGMTHLTPHDLRHLFITSCIELGFRAVDIAPWVGHRDNGALILRTYTQIRDQHQKEQAALLNAKLTALAAKPKQAA
jgi:integrase